MGTAFSGTNSVIDYSDQIRRVFDLACPFPLAPCYYLLNIDPYNCSTVTTVKVYKSPSSSLIETYSPGLKA